MKRILILLMLGGIGIAGFVQKGTVKGSDGNVLNGQKTIALSIYDSEDGGNLLLSYPDATVLFTEGDIRNISRLLPEHLLDREELWIELSESDMERVRLVNTESTLYRELPEDEDEASDSGETTETMATHLQIGMPGETDNLVVNSPKTGFGVSSPNERIDVDGAIGLKEGTAPTATSEYGKVYVNDADGHLYFIDEAGNITDLTVDANAVQSVSSSANHTGRVEHMRLIPGDGTDITESATDDTIYIRYDVGCSGVGGCSSPPSAPLLIEGASTVCTGEPGASFAVPPVSGASFYRWSVPGDAVISTGMGTNSVNVIFGSTDGNVCASAFNDCGESAQTCMAVSINRPTSPGSITGTTPVCPGQTGVSYYITSVPGATNYIWTLPPGAVLASGTGTPNITVNFGTSGGDICVQTENSCGTSTPQCLAVVMTDTPATPGAITGSAVVCEGESGVTYSISSVAEATSYSWTIPSGATITAGDGTEVITVTFGTTSGDVCVDASSICGTSSPRCLAVTVNLAPVITVNPSDVDVDEGDPATFNITATGSGLTYQWQQSTDAGGSWSNVGASSNSYTTGSTTAGMDSYQYRCIVTGSCSPVDTSTAATLTVTTGLYDFTSHTFTNAGVAGRYGPTISQCRSAYDTSPVNWDENPSFFNMTTQGIQEWIVPKTGTYRIEAWGAATEPQTYTSSYSGRYGRGARMRGDFTLTEGDKLFILVGQKPVQSQFNGGGGGTFVATGTSYTSATALIVAGGGGSYRVGYDYSGDWQTMLNASITTDGNDAYAPGGTGGGGGFSTTTDGAGAGFIGDANGGGGTRAFSFRNGGVGGHYSSSGDQDGGFGGGGHGGWGGAGGGGGYSGGGAAYNNPHPPAGGGGSYNSGTNQSNSTGANTGHGYVTIQLL